MGERVVILGASDRPDRFSWRAQQLLLEHGHRVIPVTPRLATVGGLPALDEPGQVTGPVDTVTVYLRAELLRPLVPALAALAPRRVILNPGADDPEMVAALQAEGLRVQLDCTLILLDQGCFEDHARAGSQR